MIAPAKMPTTDEEMDLYLALSRIIRPLYALIWAAINEEDRPEPASLEDRLEDVSTAATAGALRIRAMYPTGPSPVENLFTDWLARLDMVAATAMVAAYGSAWGPSDFTITRAQLLDSCLIVVGDLWDELRRLLGRDGDPAAAEPTEAAPVQAGAR